MSTTLSGPMFEPAESDWFTAMPCMSCKAKQSGAHYNQFVITGGMDALRGYFKDGQADDLNFVLFSTSGVHGSYVTVEDIEAALEKSPTCPDDDEDWCNELTVLIVQPRLCCLRHGNVIVTKEDIPFLKTLRESSWKAVQEIGLHP